MPRTAKPPISVWIVRERKRLGLKPHDLAQRLTAMGLPVADGTPRTWEAGRSPSADNIEGLEKVFGVAAPKESPARTDAGLSYLFEKLDRQADLITEMLGELRSFRLARAELLERLEALETAARLRGTAIDETVEAPAAPRPTRG